MAEPAHTGRLHSGIEHPGSRSSEGPLARAADAKAEQQRFTAAMLCEAYGQGRRDFRNLDLTGADLAGADLADAVFDGSTLKDVCLAQAKLANASFVGTLGLQAAQLAGANLAGANLPRETVDFDAPLEVVKEASKNARTLFLGMLAACAYVCITVAKSTDANLILGDTSSHLPIVGTNIPIVAFFYAAPLLLLGVYLYFQLYLQRLYERTASLPAFLPDGRALDTAIYPWLLAGIVRRHLPLLRQAQPSYATLQVILSVLLGWFVVPMTVGQIWGRALAKHDAWLTGVHIVVFAVLCTLAYAFYGRAVRTLSHQPAREKRLEQLWRPLLRRGTVAGFSASVLLLLSYNPIAHGTPARGLSDMALPVYYPFATNISAREAKLSGRKLQGMDLRGVDFSHAVLEDVDFSHADLRGARLVKANLEGSIFSDANLAGVDFSGANLKYANLCRAKLVEAKFASAVFFETQLTDADLRGTEELTLEQLEKTCGQRSVFVSVMGDPYPRSWHALKPCIRQAEKKRLAVEEAKRKEKQAKRVADEDAEKRARKEGERLAKELDVLVAKQDAAQVREVKERAARMKAKLAEERKLAKQVKSDMPTSDKISAQLASPGDSFGKSAGRTTPQMPPPRQRAED